MAQKRRIINAMSAMEKLATRDNMATMVVFCKSTGNRD